MRYLNYTFSRMGAFFICTGIVTYTYLSFGMNFQRGIKKANVVKL